MQLAMSQHAEVVFLYKKTVSISIIWKHMRFCIQTFLRETVPQRRLGGAFICNIQLKARLADYVSAIQFCQSNDIPICKFATLGRFAGY